MENVESILRKLVRFRSITNDKNASRDLLNFAEGVLCRTLHTERFESNGFSSLIATPGGKRHVRVLLAAHIDVVAGGDSLFDLQEVGPNFIGRGVADMKFAAACYLALAQSSPDLFNQCDVGVLLTSDEEIGGEHGTKYVIHQGYTADVVMLPDGAYNWGVEVSAKGVLWVDVTVRGRSTHGSRPWEGIDPFPALNDCIGKIRAAIEVNQDAFEHQHNTVTVGKILGGNTYNQVADSATANIDIRFTDEYTVADIKKLVHGACENAQEITVRFVMDAESRSVSIDNPFVVSWRQAVEQVTGIKTHIWKAHGGSDARFFPKHIPVIVTAPIAGGTHTDSEWIEKKSLLDFYAALEWWIRDSAK